MYQLVWTDREGPTPIGSGSLVGSLDSLFLVYWAYFKNKPFDVLELWQLGTTTAKIERDGRQVIWWK